MLDHFYVKSIMNLHLAAIINHELEMIKERLWEEKEYFVSGIFIIEGIGEEREVKRDK